MVRVCDLKPDTTYSVQLLGAPVDSGNPVRIRTAPKKLEGSAGLLLGLASCYYPSDQFVGNAAAIATCLDKRELTGRGRGLPNATFLCGDQIYADVPGDPNQRPMLELYRHRYHAAWQKNRLGPLLARGGM